MKTIECQECSSVIAEIPSHECKEINLDLFPTKWINCIDEPTINPFQNIYTNLIFGGTDATKM